MSLSVSIVGQTGSSGILKIWVVLLLPLAIPLAQSFGEKVKTG